MKSNSAEHIKSAVGTASRWLRPRRAACRTCLEPLERRRLLAMVTIDLGSLGGYNGESAATDINASGQVVGTSGDRSFIWQNGVMTDLGTLGAHYSRALGLNDLGQVVGTSAASAFGHPRAFLITPEDTDGNGTPDRWNRDTNADGKNDLMRDLGTLRGKYTESFAYDVNNSGQVVGFSSISFSNTQHAFRWQNGVMTDLGTFGGQRSYAYTINDAGQVGGEFYTTSDGPHAFLWKNGVVTDLGRSYGGVADINAAGRLIDASRVWTPMVPNGSSGTFATLGQLPPLDQDPDHMVGVGPDARSINSAGQVVGNQVETRHTEWAGNSTVYRAMRWVNGVPQELPLRRRRGGDIRRIRGRPGAGPGRDGDPRGPSASGRPAVPSPPGVSQTGPHGKGQATEPLIQKRR